MSTNELDGLLTSLAHERPFSRRSFLRLAGAVAASDLLVACGGSAIVTPPQSHAPFNFGVIKPITGPTASAYAPLYVPADIAIAEINQKGGILGRQIVPKIQDDEGKPANEPAVAQSLAGNDLGYVIGPVGSSLALASMQVTQRSKVIQSAYAADAVFGDAGKYPGSFNLVKSTDLDMQLFQNFIVSLGVKSVGIMQENTANGQAIAPPLADALKAKGIKTTIEAFDQLSTTSSASIARLKTAGVEFVVLTSALPADSTNQITAMVQANWQPYVIGTNGYMAATAKLIPKQVGISSSFLNKIYATQFRNFTWRPRQPVGERQRTYIGKLRQQPGILDTNILSIATGPYYDFIYVLKHAIESAKSFDYAKVKKELQNTKNFDGMICKITFTPTNHHGFGVGQLTVAAVTDLSAPESLGALPMRTH